MRLHISNPKDLFAGLIFLGVGAAAFTQAQSYQIGTATHMGPGYFPAFLGVVLMLLGAVAVVRSVRAPPERLSRGRVLPLLLILIGVMSFALLVDRAGLVPAIFALLLAACLPQVLSRPLEMLIVFLVLTVFSVGVFIHALQMPLNVF